MDSRARTPLSFAIRCDALALSGAGHLVRQIALVEELHARGHEALLLGDCDLPWAATQAAHVGLDFIPAAEDLVGQVGAAGVDVVMIDGYDFPTTVGRELRAAGIPVAAMVDGEFGSHQDADLYVDQNLGSPDPGGPGWLVGPEYVLLRDVVRARRGQPRTPNEPPRVLVVFGGSDPFGGCPVAAELLLAAGLPVHVVAIAASPEHRAALEALTPGEGQHVEVVGPQDDLPGLAMTCDLVVSAAGSSTWELACLGIPTGLVCVTDNQLLGYRAATESLAVPVGHLEQLRADADARATGVRALRALLADADRRAALGAAARELVDGDGRVRVVDAMEALAGRHTGLSGGSE